MEPECLYSPRLTFYNFLHFIQFPLIRSDEEFAVRLSANCVLPPQRRISEIYLLTPYNSRISTLTTSSKLIVIVSHILMIHKNPELIIQIIPISMCCIGVCINIDSHIHNYILCIISYMWSSLYSHSFS